MTSRRSKPLGSVSARLNLAFVVVALGAVAVFALLVTFATARDVTDLAREEREQTAAAVAEAAAVAYTQAGGWARADPATVLALSRDAGARVGVRDAAGRPVIGAPGGVGGTDVITSDVMVAGRRVGVVQVAFTSAGLTAPARHVRRALSRTVAAGAALAALLAVAVSAVAARRITRPLGTITSTVRAVSAGDRTARVGDVRAAGELGELAAAFDRMADTLDCQDVARRALVADVAHELRTPLTIMRGTLEGLTDGIIDPSPDQMASLHDDVLRLTHVLDDLEALASADAAGLTMQPRVVDLAVVTRDAAERLAGQYDTAEVDLTVQADQALVRADPLRLGQVVTNLLTNALKFTPAGGSVRISVDHDSRSARLEVTDTGIGIPIEEQGLIFDRFWRGASANSVAGSGIGLTVVAELVSAHGGHIDVDSRPGHGTRMTVTLPTAGA